MKVSVKFDLNVDGKMDESDILYYETSIENFLNKTLQPNEPRMDSNYRFSFGSCSVKISQC